jgi:hypothetical protein
MKLRSIFFILVIGLLACASPPGAMADNLTQDVISLTADFSVNQDVIVISAQFIIVYNYQLSPGDGYTNDMMEATPVAYNYCIQEDVDYYPITPLSALTGENYFDLAVIWQCSDIGIRYGDYNITHTINLNFEYFTGSGNLRHDPGDIS